MLNSVKPYQSTAQSAQRLSFKDTKEPMTEVDAKLLGEMINFKLEEHYALNLSPKDRSHILDTIAVCFSEEKENHPECENYANGFIKASKSIKA